jgi:hypothetical protein
LPLKKKTSGRRQAARACSLGAETGPHGWCWWCVGSVLLSALASRAIISVAHGLLARRLLSVLFCICCACDPFRLYNGFIVGSRSLPRLVIRECEATKEEICSSFVFGVNIQQHPKRLLQTINNFLRIRPIEASFFLVDEKSKLLISRGC